MTQFSNEAAIEWLKTFVLPFNRRVSRLGFFLAFGLISLPGKIMNSFDTPDYITVPAACLVLYMWLCIILARVHDIGLRGFWIIPVAIITFAGFYSSSLSPPPPFAHWLLLPVIIFFLVLFFYPPQRRDNRYGPYDPKRF